MSVFLYLLLSEVVYVFVDVDLYVFGYKFDDEEVEIYRWCIVFFCVFYVIDFGDCFEVELEGGDMFDWYIKLVNLVVWCVRKGFECLLLVFIVLFFICFELFDYLCVIEIE